LKAREWLLLVGIVAMIPAGVFYFWRAYLLDPAFAMSLVAVTACSAWLKAAEK